MRNKMSCGLMAAWLSICGAMEACGDVGEPVPPGSRSEVSSRVASVPELPFQLLDSPMPEGLRRVVEVYGTRVVTRPPGGSRAVPGRITELAPTRVVFKDEEPLYIRLVEAATEGVQEYQTGRVEGPRRLELCVSRLAAPEEVAVVPMFTVPEGEELAEVDSMPVDICMEGAAGSFIDLRGFRGKECERARIFLGSDGIQVAFAPGGFGSRADLVNEIRYDYTYYVLGVRVLLARPCGLYLCETGDKDMSHDIIGNVLSMQVSNGGKWGAVAVHNPGETETPYLFDIATQVREGPFRVEQHTSYFSEGQSLKAFDAALAARIKEIRDAGPRYAEQAP